jgi:hypothetical protein
MSIIFIRAQLLLLPLISCFQYLKVGSHACLLWEDVVCILLKPAETIQGVNNKIKM